MSRRKQLKPRSLKRESVDGEDLVALATEDTKDGGKLTKNNNNAEISSAAAASLMMTGVKGDDDADDDDDDAGVEMASDHSTAAVQSPSPPPPPHRPNKPSPERRAAEADRQPPPPSSSSSAVVASEGVSAGTRTAVEDRTEAEAEEEDEDAPAEDGEDEEYRCDVCHAIFASWRRFMDHRNYDCASGEKIAWINRIESDCPSRMSSRSPSSDRVAPSSPPTPSSVEISQDPLPYSIGPDENHPYACQSCEKAYSKQSYLKKHEQLVHNDQLHYGCKYCRRLFRHKRSRDRHVKLHTGDRRYRCHQCQAMFARSDHLKVHLKTHDSPRSFQCPECSLNFTNIALLTAHMLTHIDHEDGSRGDSAAGVVCYTCPLCPVTLSSAKQFEKHMEFHAAFLTSDIENKMEEDEEENNIDVEDRGKGRNDRETSSNGCHRELCSPRSEEKMCVDLPRKLFSARRIFVREESPWNNKEMEHASFRKQGHGQAVDVGGGGLECPHCNQTDFSAAALSAHINTVHAGVSGNLFSCLICGLAFASAPKLDHHMNSSHQRIFPDRACGSFQCEYCMMEFLDSTSHRLHVDSIHSERNTDSGKATVATIYCSQCTMGFPHIYALADHMHQSHGYNKSANGTSLSYAAVSPHGPFHLHAASPEQLVSHTYRDLQKLMVDSIVAGSALQDGYRCHQCDLSLPDIHTFQLHVEGHQVAATRSAARESSASSYPCSECEVSFQAEDQLESHMFSHFLSLTTEYGCTSCLKLFSKPDELQKHLMDIHAHHLYRCSLCKHVFDSKVNIQVHFAVKHSNECKVYKCSRCASVFRSEMECQLHVKVHHLGVSKPYRCFFCKDSFAAESDLQAHVASHKKQFVCPICHEAFLVEYLLDKHLETKHSSPDVQLTASRPEISVVTSMLAPQTLPPEGMLFAMQTTSPSSIVSEKRTPVSPSAFVGSASSPSAKKGDLIYKCEVCDVKFSDEGTLQKHHTHDHSFSAEMQQLMKARSTSQQSSNLDKSGGTSGATSGDKFSQLCMYCKQMFKTKGELEKHMKTHVLPSNQKCNICDEVFPSAMILAEHKLTHCKVVKGNVCVICKVSMKNEDEFFSHSQQHSFQGANMQCVICRQTLASMLELQLHGRHHFQTTPVEVYSCCVCLKSFDSKENLISRLGSSSSATADRSIENYYICKPCYHHEGSSLAELKCGTCGMKFDSHVLLAVHSLEHRRTYQCIKCQESFGTEYEIQLHVATHVLHEGNVHECKICVSVFDSPAKLQLHLIEHSFQGKQEMSCYICDRSFAQASAIQVHMLDHGMANRKYVCSLCPQRFFFSAELQNHRLTLNHNGSPNNAPKSGSTELPCPECNKVFSSYANLSAHRRSHEKHGNASVLECTMCPAQCSSVRALQEHFMSTHSEPGSNKAPLQCPECNRQFPSLSSLQGHMRVHNSGTKYSCTECGKAFSLPQNLAIHMNSHRDDIRPYECSICHKKFAKKENMKSHMRCHCGSRDQTSNDPATEAMRNSHQMVEGVGGKHGSSSSSGIHSSSSSHGDQGMATTCSKPEEHLCPICGGRFQQMVDLALHVNKIHHIKAEVVEAEIVQANETQHLLSSSSRSSKQGSAICTSESIACANGINSDLDPRPIAVLASK